jgi:hypothetical protein
MILPEMRDLKLGKIDMIHRLKPFRGTEERKAYRDCTYFGIGIEKRTGANGVCQEECIFTLTSAYSDKLFATGLRFSPSSCEILTVISNAANALIESVQGDSDATTNNRVYPLFCTGQEYETQCRNHEASIISESFAMATLGGISDPREIEFNLSRPIYLHPNAVQIVNFPAIGGCSINSRTEDRLATAIEVVASCVPIPVVQARV